MLGILDNGHEIKGLVVCYLVWLISMIYGIDLWQAQDPLSGTLFWSGWLSSSSIATPPKNHTKTYHINLKLMIW